MSDRFDKFVTQINLAQNDWRVVVGNPYISAYTHAYENYKEKLGEQKAADKEAGELFVTAACIATGSVLLASVGSASLRMLAKRTVVRIANRSLGNNFSRLFRIARKNEGVAFAMGKFLDAAKGEIKEKAEKIATTYTQTTSGIITPEPLVQYLQMDSFIRANVNCAIRTAQAVEESRVSEQEKNAHYAELMAAPIYSSPIARSARYKASLSELIELTFYLSAMLESDQLISWPGYNAMGGESALYAQSRGAKSASINQRPTDPNYPNPTLPRMSAMGSMPAYQTVGIERAGGKIQERTNELCKKVFNKEIYSSTFFGLGGPADTMKTAELRQADIWLDKLAAAMKPLNPLDAIR